MKAEGPDEHRETRQQIDVVAEFDDVRRVDQHPERLLEDHEGAGDQGDSQRRVIPVNQAHLTTVPGNAHVKTRRISILS